MHRLEPIPPQEETVTVAMDKFSSMLTEDGMFWEGHTGNNTERQAEFRVPSSVLSAIFCLGNHLSESESICGGGALRSFVTSDSGEEEENICRKWILIHW